MCVTTNDAVMINVVVKALIVEQVDEYKYLGPWVMSDDVKNKIKTRIGMIKRAFWKQRIKEKTTEFHRISEPSYGCES